MLAVTNMFPTPEYPASGTFVQRQVESLRDMNINVDVLHVCREKYGILAYAKLRDKLLNRIADFQPDLVHVMYGGVMADIVTSNARIPSVVSFCGSDLLGESLANPFRRAAAGIGVFSSFRAARKAHRIVVKSRILQDSLPCDVEPMRVRIIPNGVDLNQFKPLDTALCRKQLGWNEGNFHVLFPANSGAPVKRPHLARTATNSLKLRGVPILLHLLSGVKPADVPLWMNASDVLLLTSSHEGSPNVVKEALACNLPVVSVDVGDVRERIGCVDGCYIVAPYQGEIADCLEKVYCSHARIKGREHVQALSLPAIAGKLKALYDETRLLR